MYENHLEATGAVIQSTTESTSYCQSAPLFPNDGFPVNALLSFSARFSGSEGFSIELIASNSDILLGLQFNWMMGNIRRYSTPHPDDTTGGMFGLEEHQDFGVVIIRETGQFSICFNGMQCRW